AGHSAREGLCGECTYPWSSPHCVSQVLLPRQAKVEPFRRTAGPVGHATRPVTVVRISSRRRAQHQITSATASPTPNETLRALLHSCGTSIGNTSAVGRTAGSTVNSFADRYRLRSDWRDGWSA